MTDPITIHTSHHGPSFLEAMRAFAAPTSKADAGFSLIKGMLVCGLIGAAVVVFIRLGLRVDLEDSHFVGFVAGCVTVFVLWLSGARRMERRVLALATAASQKNDPQTFTFSAEGFRIDGAIGTSDLRWAAVEKVVVGKHATIIGLGPNNVPVPHHDLPEGMTPAAFAAQLESWRTP